MSNKGKVFSHADLPRVTQLRIKNRQVGADELKRINAYLDGQTERNRVVAMDGETPIIAEELQERALRRHSEVAANPDPLLVQLRNLMTLSARQRAWILDSFDEKGELLIPFDAPPENKAKEAAKAAKAKK